MYLPPGFTGAPAPRYPVLYLLHGNDQPATAFLQIGVPRELDRLIARHAIPAADRGDDPGGRGANNWRNDGNLRYESYVLEVQELIDRMLPTIATRGARAIAGDSMGGYGAMNVALGNPYRFGVVESWLGFFNGLGGELHADRPVISRAGAARVRLRRPNPTTSPTRPRTRRSRPRCARTARGGRRGLPRASTASKPSKPTSAACSPSPAARCSCRPSRRRRSVAAELRRRLARIASGGGATSMGAVAVGALRPGAFAVGALAIGRLAVGRLAVRRGAVGTRGRRAQGRPPDRRRARRRGRDPARIHDGFLARTGLRRAAPADRHPAWPCGQYHRRERPAATIREVRMAAVGSDLEHVLVGDRELWQDGPPHELFKRAARRAARCTGPSAISRVPRARPGFWSVTTAEDVHTVSRDWRTYSSELGGITAAAGVLPAGAHAGDVHRDGPAQARPHQGALPGAASRPSGSPRTRRRSGRSCSTCSTGSRAARRATSSTTSPSRSSRA